jgi:hypothetical protein
MAHTALTRALFDHNRATPAFQRVIRKRLAAAWHCPTDKSLAHVASGCDSVGLSEIGVGL